MKTTLKDLNLKLDRLIMLESTLNGIKDPNTRISEGSNLSVVEQCLEKAQLNFNISFHLQPHNTNSQSDDWTRSWLIKGLKSDVCLQVRRFNDDVYHTAFDRRRITFTIQEYDLLRDGSSAINGSYASPKFDVFASGINGLIQEVLAIHTRERIAEVLVLLGKQLNITFSLKSTEKFDHYQWNLSWQICGLKTKTQLYLDATQNNRPAKTLTFQISPLSIVEDCSQVVRDSSKDLTEQAKQDAIRSAIMACINAAKNMVS